MNDSAQKKVDGYLDQLRKRLRGMSARDTDDIVAELRAHIVEKASAGGAMTAESAEATLAALGSPEELASEYVTDDLLARAEVSRSPVRILRSVFHLASLSFAGFFVLLTTIAGYTLGVVALLAGFMKLVHPHTAGVWLMQAGDDLEISVRMGFGSVPAAGREVLGKWLVPVGLVVGCGLLVLTTKFSVWCMQRFRKSRALPGGGR